MAEKFQNDDNMDNQNTLNIPIPQNRPDYRRPNPNRRTPSGQNVQRQPPRPYNNQRQYTGSQNRPQNNGYSGQYNNSGYSGNAPQYQNNGYQQYGNYQNRQQGNSYSGQYNNSGYGGNPQQYQNNGYQQYNGNYQNRQQSNGYQQNRNYNNQPQQHSRQSAPPPKRKKRKHRSILGKVVKRVVLSLFTILVLLFGIYSCTAFGIIGKIGKQDSVNRNRTSGTLSKSYVRSVLVIGSDGRSADEQGRSDSMILLSFNSRTNEITLTSFMRDCYVNIPNYGMDKLNASYSYGGADLLMDTIESNFMIEIDDYVTVNFISFAGIIDAVGGIDIDVSAEEAQAINDILFSEVNGLMGDDQWADFVDGGEKCHLNGKQALSYARIRYVGNSDFERTSRQREVITKVIPKIINPVALSRISKNVVPQVNTNMSSIEMYLLSLRLPFAIRYDVKQIQIPAEGTYYPEDVWTAGGELQNVLQVDLNANYNVLENEIFGH